MLSRFSRPNFSSKATADLVVNLLSCKGSGRGARIRTAFSSMPQAKPIVIF